jgi:hypothetical protein
MERGGSEDEEDAAESRDRVDDERERAPWARRRPYKGEDACLVRMARVVDVELAEVWRLCGACGWAMPRRDGSVVGGGRR